MNAKLWNRMGTALALAPLLAGCVSNAGLRQAIADREAEIRDLREERAALKGQVQSLKAQLDTTRGELTGLADTGPIEAGATKFPALDDLGIDYGMRNGHMVISIPSSITFSSGKSDLSKDGQKALREVAATLKREYASGVYFVEGHTDTDPIKKSKFASNRDLSLSRAMAVLTFLVEECSIPDEQCRVVGHGQYSPISSNDGADGKAKNRRVEIVVHSVES